MLRQPERKDQKLDGANHQKKSPSVVQSHDRLREGEVVASAALLDRVSVVRT